MASLRALRVPADYDCEALFTESDAKLALVLAEAIISDLENLPP